MTPQSLRETVLIVGCGDIGQRLARPLIAEARTVHGVVRSAATADRCAALGVKPQLLDLDLQAPPAADWVFWLAPPPDGGSTDPRLRRWLATRPRFQKLVYLSTSGVYGDCQGRWIDEDEPLKPRTDRARRRADAERALEEAAPQSSGSVMRLRVPGIYGPGRLPRERLAGMRVVQESEAPWSNRIHADDLAQAALAALRHGRNGAAYNISDDAPTTMTDYYSRCAERFGLPPLQRVSMAEAEKTFTRAALSFLQESKRLSNRRMREELGVALQYPDLPSGLAACGT
jgi:nucleoside-diphosphate-sugar epimerase